MKATVVMSAAGTSVAPGAAEAREDGFCGDCGAPVIRVTNSILPTCRTDGVRYVDATRRDDGWCMFRCHNDECRAVISDTWQPKAAADFDAAGDRA